jgi:hypothetical protein
VTGKAAFLEKRDDLRAEIDRLGAFNVRDGNRLKLGVLAENSRAEKQ